MSGNRYLLDTNAAVALLQGDLKLVETLADARWIGISVISQLEFLAFSDLTETDRDLFSRFVQRVDVIDLLSTDSRLIDTIIDIRRRFRLKLPDAIVAATAFQRSAAVVTADQEFSRVDIIRVVHW